MKVKRIQKVISFPVQLLEKAEYKANKAGMLLPEYIRHVILNDVTDELYGLPVIDDKETVRAVKESEEDFKRGRYVTIEPDEAINLDKLTK
jgi:hypothetical protein